MFSNTFVRMKLVTQFITNYVSIYVNIILIVLTSRALADSRVRVRFARARAELFDAVPLSCLVNPQPDKAIYKPVCLTLACLLKFYVRLLWGDSRIVSVNAPLFNLKCCFK